MPVRVHLVCNAHLDPVWQWPWEEGLAEALSTFRIAADFCDRHRGFVFNHNEALLYRWVERYEPELFARIRRLVEAGRWHVAGGAYLQPDCNEPSGESHVRQYLLARRYFEDRLGTYPRTAYNFDPFGHPEGLAQILAGCGMQRYLFCRPSVGDWELPEGPFRWRDRSGSEVVARRGDDHYLSSDRIFDELGRWLEGRGEDPTLILWGIGNHGGGPSRHQYAEIRRFARSHPEYELVDSTPDAFFDEHLAAHPVEELPVVRGEIANVAPGCYTSMARLKRLHRATEQFLLAVERDAAIAWWWKRAPYPGEALADAWRDVCFAQFHDVLPGSGSPEVEADSLACLTRTGEHLRRLRFDLLQRWIADEPPAKGRDVPCFVHNHHPFPVRTQVEFEVQLDHRMGSTPDPIVTLTRDGKRVASQRLHASAVCAGDGRPRLAVDLALAPFEIARLDEHYEPGGKKPRTRRASAANLRFRNRHFAGAIDPQTGLLASLRRPGERRSLLGPGALEPVAFRDLDHSWRCGTPGHPRARDGLDRVGFVEDGSAFRLATARQAARLAPSAESKRRRGVGVEPLRIVEDGDLRTVVEAWFVLADSAIRRRYVIGHRPAFFEVRDRVFWNHRDHMLKAKVPLAFAAADVVSEAIHSAQVRPVDETHEERHHQRWCAVRGKLGKRQVHVAAIGGDLCAHACTADALYLNYLRSPAYASFNIGSEDEWRHRISRERMDVGEHEIRYRLAVGARVDEARLRREAAVLHAPPTCVAYFPQRRKVDRRRRRAAADTLTVDDDRVEVVAVKKAEGRDELLVRLLETGGRDRTVKLRVRPFGRAIPVAIGAYRLATIAVRRGRELRWRRCDLVERTLR